MAEVLRVKAHSLGQRSNPVCETPPLDQARLDPGERAAPIPQAPTFDAHASKEFEVQITGGSLRRMDHGSTSTQPGLGAPHEYER